MVPFPIFRQETLNIVTLLSQFVIDNARKDAKFAFDLSRKGREDEVCPPASEATIENVGIHYWLFSLYVILTRLNVVSKQEGELNPKKFVMPVYLKLAEHGAKSFAKQLSPLTGDSEDRWVKIIVEHRQLAHEVFSSMPVFSEKETFKKDAGAWNWTLADISVVLTVETNAIFKALLTKSALKAFVREAPYFDEHLQFLYKQMKV